ncbi:MAG: M13 family peptidase, partial [Bacteroidota bacterium]
MKNVFLLLITASIIFYSCKSSDTVSENNNNYLDRTSMDSSVKPGDNFYLFVNGKWLKTAVIPSTQSSVGSAMDLFNRTKENLHNILDSISKGTFAAGSVEQKAGD